MQKLKRLAVAGLCSWAGAGVGVAMATDAFTDDGTGGSNTRPGLRLASEVLVNTNIIIQSLGFYDKGLDGLTLSHNVNLYDITNGTANPPLLGSVTVPAASTAGLSNGFEYVALSSPVPVAAGTTIGVVAYQLDGNSDSTAGDDPYTDNATFNSTDLTYVNNAYLFDNATTGFPDASGAGGDTFGAGSFQYVTPEPASMALLGVAGLALLGRRRRV